MNTPVYATDDYVLLEKTAWPVRQREEPVITLDQARRRLLPQGIAVDAGPRHRTLALAVPGLHLALAQPARRTQEALESVTGHAKTDLIQLLSLRERHGQGIVFLPHYAVVTRSPRGAGRMADRRLSYEVALRPRNTSDDLLARAVRWIEAWQQEEQEDLAAYDAFAEAIRQRPSD